MSVRDGQTSKLVVLHIALFDETYGAEATHEMFFRTCVPAAPKKAPEIAEIIQFNSIQFNSIQFNSIQFDLI